ncbi:hypothetical protein GIB67_017650 [Kingdonia uniflora]|uniref:Uncharacterized protein n=1 Tax=Kingdonia uniflora TaxID=39325 RepID=A0A7J7NA85_9MAGN|nr:hypothetical protein GIB67_017650 [Kingdonia uniflora]
MEATSYQSWKKDNALIKSWIRGSLTEKVLHLITGLSTTREFKGICDELAAMQKPVSDDDKVNWLANGLGPKYFNFCDAHLSKPPTPTYSQFITALQNHELRNQAYTEERVLDHHMAFMGQRGGRGSRFHGRDVDSVLKVMDLFPRHNIIILKDIVETIPNHHFLTSKKAALIRNRSNNEPRTLAKAPKSFQWVDAMREELSALARNNTWVIVPRANEMNVIGFRWVYKTKLKADGAGAKPGFLCWGGEAKSGV